MKRPGKMSTLWPLVKGRGGKATRARGRARKAKAKEARQRAKEKVRVLTQVVLFAAGSTLLESVQRMPTTKHRDRKQGKL